MANTSSAKKNVVKQMHSETIKFIKAEIHKCDMGESEVMNGNLKCNERHTVNKIGIAATIAIMTPISAIDGRQRKLVLCRSLS